MRCCIRTLAFFSFCLCASGVYLLNDLLDLDADRHHPRKRLRPFAAGTLPLAAGLVAAPLLTLAAFALALAISPAVRARAGRLLRADAGLFVRAQAHRHARYRRARRAVHDSHHRRHGRAAHQRVVLAARLLDVPVPEPGDDQALHRTAQPAAARRQPHAPAAVTPSTTCRWCKSLGGASGYLAVLVLALYINSTASEAAVPASRKCSGCCARCCCTGSAAPG